MKTLLKIIPVLLVAISFSANADAQQRNNSNKRGQNFNRADNFQNRPFLQQRGQGKIWRLNLTEEQFEQIAEVRLQGQKEMLPLRNQLREKNARLQTLTTSGSYDENSVNALIEEIGDLRVEIMQKRVAHQQQIRSLLDEDQRIQLDAQRSNSIRGNRSVQGRNQRCQNWR